MGTGAPFVPTTFAPTSVRPSVASPSRTLPYISPSDYRFAPTAVGTAALVTGSASQTQDSTASLAQVLSRASSWVDTIVFKRQPTTGFQASAVYESDYVSMKADGGFLLTCNLKPVSEVLGIAVGALPSQLQSLSQNVAGDLFIDGRVIRVPASWSSASSPTPLFAYPADTSNKLFVVWGYVAGYPNFAAGAQTPNTTQIAKGATSIVLIPPYPGATTIPGIYAGTALKIVDGANTEWVTAASAPNGFAVTLQNPGTAFSHTINASPDFLRITALPEDVEQAQIALTSVILKMQGTRAMILPGAPGGLPTTQALSASGSLQDYQAALALLKKFEIVYLHG